MTHLKEFLSDAGPLIQDLKKQISMCRQDEPEESVMDDLFRHLHSLKSGAAFFQLIPVETHIHSMESLFEQMKNTRGTKEFFALAEKLSASLPRLESLLRNSEDSQQDFYLDQSDEPIEISLSGRAGGDEVIELNPFQKQLLWEAERRGDSLFCLTVQLDPDERLPYVRAFLVLSNLELKTNVVYTYPEPDREDQDYSSLTFILTSQEGDLPIFDAVNVDGILQTSLVQMDYSHFGSPGGRGAVAQSDIMVQEALAPVMSKVELETDSLAKMKESLMEMKEIVLPMAPGIYQKEPLLGLIREMEQNLNAVSLIPLSSLYSNLKRFVKDSAERMEKQVTTDFRGGQFGLSIRSLELVSRVLIQLIRNALSHGIETPAERMDAGKNPVGTISLNAFHDGKGIRILFGDDGRGVDLAEVEKKAREKGIAADLENNLLQILTKPGFSTNDQVDRMSGRGIGLDLVAHDIENALGGVLSLETVPGKETVFTVTLPGERDYIPMMIFQVEGRLMALPKRNVGGVFPTDSRDIHQKEHNLLYYKVGADYLPLFNLRGMISSRRTGFSTPYVLILQHQGRKAVMPVDDLVIEKDVPRDQFFLGEQKEPFLYDVKVGENKADFMYLSPSIIG